MIACLGLGSMAARAQQPGDRYAVLIGGLGGQPEYTEAFQQYLFETRQALVDGFGVPAEQVIVLGEQRISDQDFVTDVSTAENIRARFEALASQVTPEDHVYILLFGHGSYDGEHAHLNIPRRDLSSADYAALVDGLEAGRIVFINTAPSSGPFVEALSAPERIVITATQTGTERNETRFPQFLVEALTSPNADLDKNGDLSVQEVFIYAAEATDRSYTDANNLATEHPVLDDDGDGQGHRVSELADAPDGNLAAVTYLQRSRPVAMADSAAGSDAAPLLREREAIERAVAELKSRKVQMETDAYYAELETLFVRLARLNETLEVE